MRKLIQAVTFLVVGIFLTAASPYTDMGSREIKALSRDRIEALKTGGGASYALTAELNGFPGPRHVLDLAEKLKLTKEQYRAATRLFHRMKAEAIPLENALIQKERDLEKLFHTRRADENSLFRATAEIGAVESKLRATHLKYHLAMSKVLTPDQHAAYDRLRGYRSTTTHHDHGR
jgi:Spy/CpxP family protein refolding chaperone